MCAVAAMLSTMNLLYSKLLSLTGRRTPKMFQVLLGLPHNRRCTGSSHVPAAIGSPWAHTWLAPQSWKAWSSARLAEGLGLVPNLGQIAPVLAQCRVPGSQELRPACGIHLRYRMPPERVLIP